MTSLACAPLAVHRLHEGRKADIKCVGKEADVDQAHVPLAALDAADVGPMESRSLSECLLAQATAKSETANGSSEGHGERRGGWSHTATLGTKMTMSLQTLSIITCGRAVPRTAGCGSGFVRGLT